MKVRYPASLYLGLICGSMLAQSSSTPVGALEELVCTRDPQIISRHLPQTIQERVEVLPAKERNQYLQGLVDKVSDNGKIKVRAAGDAWEVLDRDGKVVATVRLKNVFVSGPDALLQFEAERGQGAMVSMRLEGEDWRFTGVSEFRATDLGVESDLRRYSPHDHNEDAAISALAMIRGQVTYSFRSYPDGYPPSLASVIQRQRTEQGATRAEPASALPTKEVSWLEHDPMFHDGYVFRYVLIDPGSRGAKGQPERSGQWYATATPVEYGTSGTRSFFIDQTGVIRSTAENREANISDLPLSAQ